ncbi:MAG: tagaturonate epimerase family protein [Clostridia bacterium]
MKGWKCFMRDGLSKGLDEQGLRTLARENPMLYGVYHRSVHVDSGTCYFIAREQSGKILIAFGESSGYRLLHGQEAVIHGEKARICDMDPTNAAVIRELFPFTRPSSHQGRNITIGLGDRLGLASPGHINSVRNLPIFPVLAQQSIRELHLTGRTYDDVLSAASWAVFQEDYTSGYGADGDHLKSREEIRMALDAGFTMITLDCSEHIDNTALALPPEKAKQAYLRLDPEERRRLEHSYLGRIFRVSEQTEISYDPATFHRLAVTYHHAVEHAISLFKDMIEARRALVDFELSIDETLVPTSPEAHWFVASELMAGGVTLTSLAPRFCGQFQKGIDYRGDRDQFEKEFSTHSEIAQHFGYKLSIHSGSDKFSVFPVIGKTTGGRYHLKTAGTNWLEAVRVIAMKNPSLYRQMHAFSLSRLEQAKKHYQVTADVTRIPDIGRMHDNDLPGLMDMEDSRQLMHITYGLLLSEEDQSGLPVFRDTIYKTLHEYEKEYGDALKKHIGKHLDALGVRPVF